MGAPGGPPPGPFKILAINDYIPEKIKPWIFILLVCVVQFAGSGVYLSTMNESSSDLALMREDIMMAGFAGMAGMALYFTIMLRVKFRLPTKPSLLICFAALVIANIICLKTDNLFILIITCFFAGIFRMWATFECNSTLQLWITPNRDMPIFFCYVYLIVNSAILLGSGGQLYISLFSNWMYVNYTVIALLLIMMLVIIFIFNSRRFMPFMPLLGVDWLGALLWGLILLNVNFICIYGDYFDWWSSNEIQIATGTLIGLLALNLLRASFIRHPYISLQTFKYKPVIHTLLLYLAVDIFVSPSHLLEHIYFEEVLGYDTQHMIYVNIISWSGIVVGSLFTWRYFAIAKNSFKSTFIIGFLGLLSYQIMMYFFVDASTSKEYFAIPLFLRNFGYVTMGIVMISELMKVPFPHFFQALSVQMFMSAACGSSIGVAVLTYFFKWKTAENFQFISSGIDSVNENLTRYSHQQLEHTLEIQTLVMSFKELYGYLSIAAIVFLLILILYRYPYLPTKMIFPKWKSWKKIMKKDLVKSN